MNSESKNTYETQSEEFRKSFGQRLRGGRKDREYTIDEACKALDVPRSTYSGWELGRRLPQFSALSDLANLFETNVDYLMLKNDTPNSQSTNDLKDFIEIKEITYEGKPLTEEQKAKLAKLMKAFLEDDKE